jgi:HK97 family phage portal protein
MAFLAQAFARTASAKGSSYDLLRQIAGYAGRITKSGKSVNIQSAIEVSAVMACLRVRANGLAQVPLKLMQKSSDGKTRLPAENHPLYFILKTRPNSWQTAFEYLETLSLHLDLAGNHYSFINRSNRAGIMELIPFIPGSVTVKRAADFSLTYEVRSESGSTQVFPAKAIWHVRGPSWNSWQGLEAVQLAREAIGLSMATEEQQSRMQRNGAKVSGTYSVEGTLKDDQYKALKKWIDEEISGSDNAGKVMVMDRSAKWLNTSMTGIDAETLMTRRFQVEEICRHFQVNPILIFAESKNTTYASAAQMFLAHLVHGLAPTYRRLEQSIDANLLTDADRAAGIYANFVDAAMLRGSAVETHQLVRDDVNAGIITPNEGRAIHDLNPDADPASDRLRVPAGMAADDSEPDTSVEDAVDEAVKSLQLELKSLRDRPAPQPINVDARTNVTLPEFKTGDTNITMPEMKASNVNVQVDAPTTTLSVEAPTINVQPPEVSVSHKAGDITVLPADVNVHMPARKTETIVERNINGAIISARQLEQDV